MTDTRTIYTAHDVADLLNALPTLFGFRPSESLVAVATQGPRRRFGFRLRVDIPPPRHVEELAHLIVDHLRHQGAEGAILVAVTAKQEVASELIAAVEHHLDDIELVIAVRADDARYWVETPGFPSDGIAYETSDHHLSIVQAVAAGQQILPDREALVARFGPVTEPRRSRMMEQTGVVLAEIDVIPDDDLVVVGRSQVEPILGRALVGDAPSDADLVRLSVWLSNHGVLEEVWGLISRDNAREMLRLLTQVASVVVPPFEPSVLGMAGFSAWLCGDGAQALIAVERALEADPEHSIATGVLRLLEGGVSPVHWGDF